MLLLDANFLQRKTIVKLAFMELLRIFRYASTHSESRALNRKKTKEPNFESNLLLG